MTQIASDAFTSGSNVALESYSSNWTKVSGDNSLSVSGDYDRVYFSTTGTTRYRYTGATPSSADYSVSVDVYVASTLATSCAGVLGRASASGDTFYLARTVQGTGYQMFKCVSSSYTQLGSTSTKTFSGSTTYNVKLEMNGTAIKTYVEGSGTSSISATDSAITAAGYSGIYKYEASSGSDTTGHHIDNFSADTLVSGTDAAIAGTQETDVVAVAVEATTGAALATTQATDVAAVAVEATTGVAIAGVQASDVAAVNVTASTGSGTDAEVSATQASDVAAVAVSATTGVAIAPVQSSDVAQIQVSATLGAAIAANQGQDIAAILMAGVSIWTPQSAESTTWANRSASTTTWTNA